MNVSGCVFAVVGHVNKGKSSVVATLTEDDSVRVSREPGTTSACSKFEMRVDGRTLFTLVDTPGFEQARHALAWMREREGSVADRSETVASFVREHVAGGAFPEECELLAPILDGAGILYVVDGSRPYSPEYEAEMEILRWTGRARMALVNQISAHDHTDVWRAALDQYFSLVKSFDAHRAGFEARVALLRSMCELRDDWRPSLETAIGSLEADRARRRRDSARAIADMLGDSLSLTREERAAANADLEPLKATLQARFHDDLRARERECRSEIEDLYLHRRLVREETELDLADRDLFAESTWLRLGLDRRQLAVAGAVGGAVVGGAIDASVAGASLLTGTLVGGAVGGVWGWLSQGRLARVSVRGLSIGGKRLTVGPMKSVQFPWVLLDRALLHASIAASRAHARRETAVIASAAADSPGIVGQLAAEQRREFEALFTRLRKARYRGSNDSDSERARLAEAIEPLLADLDRSDRRSHILE
jgi:hypothetical protein